MYILPDNRGQPRLSAVLLPDIRGQSRLSAVLAVNGMGMALLHTYTLYIAARMLQNGEITFVSIRPVDRRVDRNHSTVTKKLYIVIAWHYCKERFLYVLMYICLCLYRSWRRREYTRFSPSLCFTNVRVNRWKWSTWETPDWVVSFSDRSDLGLLVTGLYSLSYVKIYTNIVIFTLQA